MIEDESVSNQRQSTGALPRSSTGYCTLLTLAPRGQAYPIWQKELCCMQIAHMFRVAQLKRGRTVI